MTNLSNVRLLMMLDDLPFELLVADVWDEILRLDFKAAATTDFCLTT